MRSRLVGLITGLVAAALALGIGSVSPAPTADRTAVHHVLADNAGPAGTTP